MGGSFYDAEEERWRLGVIRGLGRGCRSLAIWRTMMARVDA